jgi:hypothetical protein
VSRGGSGGRIGKTLRQTFEGTGKANAHARTHSKFRTGLSVHEVLQACAAHPPSRSIAGANCRVYPAAHRQGSGCYSRRARGGEVRRRGAACACSRTMRAPAWQGPSHMVPPWLLSTDTPCSANVFRRPTCVAVPTKRLTRRCGKGVCSEMQQLVGARCLAAGVRLSTPIFTAAAVNRARTRMLSEAHMGQVPHTPLTTGSGKFQTARLARKSPAVSWARRLSKLADGGADAAGSLCPMHAVSPLCCVLPSFAHPFVLGPSLQRAQLFATNIFGSCFRLIFKHFFRDAAYRF